jgi:hypothetical protein
MDLWEAVIAPSIGKRSRPPEIIEITKLIMKKLYLKE